MILFQTTNIKTNIFLFALILTSLTGFRQAGAVKTTPDQEDPFRLPALLRHTPSNPIEKQGFVNSDGSSLEDARSRLQQDARKLDADAVIQVRCQKGGLKKEHILSYKMEQASCRGLAVKFKKNLSPKSKSQKSN